MLNQTIGIEIINVTCARTNGVIIFSRINLKIAGASIVMGLTDPNGNDIIYELSSATRCSPQEPLFFRNKIRTPELMSTAVYQKRTGPPSPTISWIIATALVLPSSVPVIEQTRVGPPLSSYLKWTRVPVSSWIVLATSPPLPTTSLIKARGMGI